MNNILDSHLKAYEGELQYDFDNNILLNWYPQRILKFTEGLTSLLELGLGHGYTTNIFSEKFAKHVVLDGSNSIIKNFKKKYPLCNAEIKETYFEAFNTEERFDVIILGFVLEHVNDPVKILQQFKKFLSKKGKVFIAVPNAEGLNRRIGFLAGILSNLELLSENDHLLGHKRYYTVNSLTNDIEKAGYTVKKMEGIYLKPITTSQMISLNLNKEMINALCKIGVSYPELSCGILAEISIKE